MNKDQGTKYQVPKDMKLQTIVDIKPSDRKIGYEDKILMLGSCFSDEIGAQMQQRYLHVTCNPFGTLARIMRWTVHTFPPCGNF